MGEFADQYGDGSSNERPEVRGRGKVAAEDAPEVAVENLKRKGLAGSERIRGWKFAVAILQVPVPMGNRRNATFEEYRFPVFPLLPE
jgi:hypothetical protein